MAKVKLHEGKAAMGLFLISELIFFVMLGIAYVIFRDSPPGPAARPLDATRTGFYTVALLASSVSWRLAERHSKAGQRSQQRWWMAATLLLGATFIIGQALEYAHLFRLHTTVAAGGIFAATFFTLTGFHGLHVAVGLLVLAIMFGLACLSNPRWPTTQALETAGWYWHFVDGVWVVIYSLVYLWR